MNGCFGIYNEEQYKENKVMGYYYNKLIKKVLVMLRFNMFMERSRYYDDARQDKQRNHEYNDKIFNFFHNENDAVTNNASDNYKQYVEMFEHNNNNNNHANVSSSSSPDKDFERQQSPIKDECESVSQVNELIDHLECRYKQLLRKTKATKPSKSLTTNNSIMGRNNDRTSSKIKRNAISVKVSPTKISPYIKAKQYCTKVNNKNIKRNSSHYNNKTHSKQICITCPYCVSNIKHNKCVVNGNKLHKQLPSQPQFDPNLLLGAPSFSKNTFNFIHKNL